MVLTDKVTLYFDDPLKYMEFELFKKRKIMLVGDVNLSNMSRVTTMIELLASQSKKPITVILNSPGGFVYDGLLLYGTIKSYVDKGVRIVGEVRGLAASMGAVILQAFSWRVANRFSRFQIHEVTSEGVSGSASEQEEQVLELKKVNDMIAMIIAERCNKAIDEVKKIWTKRDVWFSAQEARDWGLVDEVV